MSGWRNPIFLGRNPWGSSVVPASPLYIEPRIPTQAERRAEHERYRRETIGRRVRFLETHVQASRFPGWHPRQGEQGTIIDVPAMDMIGGGPKVKWDSGRVWSFGSMSLWEFVGAAR